MQIDRNGIKDQYSFYELDRNRNGVLDPEEVGPLYCVASSDEKCSGREPLSPFGEAYKKYWEAAIDGNKQKLLATLDRFDTNQDGHISSWNEWADLKKFLMDGNPRLSGKYLDEMMDKYDESYGPTWWVSLDMIKEKLKPHFEWTAVREGSEMAQAFSAVQLSRILSEEEFGNPFKAYVGMNVAQVYEVNQRYEIGQIKVTEQEYEKWKLFARVAGANNFLDIKSVDKSARAPVVAKTSGKKRRKKTYAVPNNSELKALLDIYGTKGRLNKGQQDRLLAETGLKFYNRERDGVNVYAKPYDVLNTSIVATPGFFWNRGSPAASDEEESKGYRFYDLFRRYFIDEGIIEDDTGAQGPIDP